MEKLTKVELKQIINGNIIDGVSPTTREVVMASELLELRNISDGEVVFSGKFEFNLCQLILGMVVAVSVICLYKFFIGLIF